MALTSTHILILFSIMGGFIAFFGDWLGRTMGKKRLRLLHLRPRHTATTMTVLAGMIIPVATTAALYVLSEPVQEWLVRGTELVAEKRQLEKENSLLKVEQQDLTAQAEHLQSEVDKRSEESTKLTRHNKQLMATNEKLQSQNQKAATELKKAIDRERKLNNNIRELRVQETKLSKEVKLQAAEVEKISEELQTTRNELRVREQELNRMNQDSIELAEEVHKLTRQRDELSKESQRLTDRVIDLRQTEEELNNRIEQLTQLAQGIAANMEAIRTSDVLFRKGEELSRMMITGGLQTSEARNTINQIIRMSDLAARERGVPPDNQGRSAAMQERFRSVGNGQFIRISVEDQINALVEAIGRSSGELVMIATSYYNYFKGETLPVPLTVNIFFNRIVYNEGDIIAEGIVDGDATPEDIVDQILEFLSTQVRQNAEKAGMIPVHGQEASLGAITFEQMAALVREIESKRGQVKIIAIASRNTRSAEPLIVEFRVLPKR
jgi:uncharacterized protein (DUF3084 family)